MSFRFVFFSSFSSHDYMYSQSVDCSPLLSNTAQQQLPIITNVFFFFPFFFLLLSSADLSTLSVSFCALSLVVRDPRLLQRAYLHVTLRGPDDAHGWETSRAVVMCRYVSLVDSVLPLTKFVLHKDWDPKKMGVTLILQARCPGISSCPCVLTEVIFWNRAWKCSIWQAGHPPALPGHDALNWQIQLTAFIETAMSNYTPIFTALPMQAAEVKSLCAIEVVHTGPMVLAFQVSLA